MDRGDKMEKYKDQNLSHNQRAEDLVSKMTIEEKASMLNYKSAAIPRLNIPAYNWWNEGLHGVARAGTATMFPQAIALAASFDTELMKGLGHIVGLETRAKYNMYSGKNDHDIYKGLTLWSPNISMFRDPRWGRGYETYGEDPYLTAQLGVAFVKGVQGEDKTMLAAACAKHYAVHSGPEGLRHEFDAAVSKKDMEEYYLPHFKALVEAGVEGIMGAYNRVNGEGACASEFLMDKLSEWGFDGYFVSDYKALEGFHTKHNLTQTVEQTAALALKMGCHICDGYVYEHIMSAHSQGLITEEDITKAAVAAMRTRMRLGLFDDSCKHNKVTFETIARKKHSNASLKAALRSMVLLKNDGILPLNSEKYNSIGVIGPNADSLAALRANYFGTSDTNITFLQGIKAEFEKDKKRVCYSLGCPIFDDLEQGLALLNDRIAEAVYTAEHADVVILCVGLDANLEGEEGDAGNQFASGDKTSLYLPKSQRILIKSVLDVGKPTIIVVASGSALNIEGEAANAIIQAWYPGSHGGIALADIIFGKVSPSGKLPVTFYEGTELLPDFSDYSLKNRTYRYAENNVLYPFGYGLTYGKVSATKIAYNDRRATVTLKNSGRLTTEEVVQLYIKDINSPHAVKNYKLCGFKRVSVPSGYNITVTIELDKTAFDIVDEDGKRFVDSKSFILYAGVCQPNELSEKLSNTKCISYHINF